MSGTEVVHDEVQSLKVAGEQFEWQKTRRGLDHFEGRTAGTITSQRYSRRAAS
ncbi:MAG: hypothetical protein U0792_14555 [Gemmataceae bacterium]